MYPCCVLDWLCIMMIAMMSDYCYCVFLLYHNVARFLRFEYTLDRQCTGVEFELGEDIQQCERK